MKYERIYEFLEEFLEWNFRRLPEEMETQLHGSPSFAYHTWLNLSKMRVNSSVSVILFDDPYYLHHKQTLEIFMRRGRADLHNTPVHFVTTIHDSNSDVHFDLKGDITTGNCRIRLIQPLGDMRLDRLLHQDRVPKSLHGDNIYALKTVLNRMERCYSSWVLSEKKKHWKEFDPYHKVLASLGNRVKVTKNYKPALKNKS